MARKAADIIVGIDFGMTCTAVAWSMGPDWAAPKTIQRWPGRPSHELRNKVDTSISYDFRTNVQTAWGFSCDPDNNEDEYNSLFKLNLDPDHKDASPFPPTFEQAQGWYQDYMRSLYEYIIQYFRESTPRFASKRIDFVFSVPVTWKNNPALLAEIERLIRAAGFGSRELETASVYLTEAEAAAIYAASNSMKRGDVFLVVDAGGGTTDLNVLKVQSAAKHNIELEPLSWTEGAAVGSTLIDYKVRTLVKERLELIQNHIPAGLELMTTQMMLARFESYKCDFGNPQMDFPRLYLPIPGADPGLNFPQAQVEDSKVVITKSEVQEIFDNQVKKMCDLIDKQLRLLRERRSNETLTYFVLSGGLGSSPYVQSRIRARYESSGADGNVAVGDRPQILIAREPQLAVVHGLVVARCQANRGDGEVYIWRCSPVSYGILCRELYDEEKHQGETVVQDPFDKKRWAERQIHWVIKQGQVVKADTGVSEYYRCKLQMGEEERPWKTHIVSSTLPPDQLPQSMRREGAREVCSFETILKTSDMTRKNRHWYNLRREYNLAEFEIRILIGAGLKFEIWGASGLRSREHSEIDVQWENAADSKEPKRAASLDGNIYRRR